MNTSTTITCDRNTLTLNVPVGDLPDDLRVALVDWLTEHDIDVDLVAIGTLVERHEETQSVAWRERTEHGTVVHQNFPAVMRDVDWPAPFPGVLGCLGPDQVSPSAAGPDGDDNDNADDDDHGDLRAGSR